MKAIETGLLGYGEFDRVATLAVAAGEHLLLVGAPGRAKTLAVRRFCAHLDGGLFSVQLSKFSDETALFGLPNMKELREKGEIVYPKRGLATCRYFHADEIFDASDVLLRTLLSSLEERLILRGEKIEHIPLNSCFATANYVRRNEVVDAIIDRFVLSMCVPEPSLKQRAELYNNDHSFEVPPVIESKVTMEDLLRVRQEAEKVKFQGELVEALMDWAAEQKFSPRRERKMAKLLRVAVAMDGESEIREHHIDLVRFIVPLAPDAAQAGKINSKDVIKPLKDKLKVLLNERQQLEEIARLSEVKGTDLQAMRELVAAVKKLQGITPVNDKVAARQNEQTRELVQRHAKLVADLGVTL